MVNRIQLCVYGVVKYVFLTDVKVVNFVLTFDLIIFLRFYFLLMSYTAFNNATVEVSPLVKSHITHILKKIKGKLNLRTKLRNAFSFNLDLLIHHLLFVHIYRIIRDYRTENGSTLPVNVKVTKDRRTTLTKLYTISFYSLHAFHFHFTHLSQHAYNITTFTEKKVKQNKVKLAISLEKPLVIIYKPATETMKITGHYDITNQYGELCSY